MEEKLNCFLILPLREMALRRIAVVLMNKPDVLAMIEEFPLQPFREDIEELIDKKTGAAVSKLPLPASLKKEIVPILKAVGLEVLKWKYVHDELFYYSNEGFDVGVEKLYWTTAGTVDYQKTAERLVQSDVVDSFERFELACLYGMEDCIPAFWENLPDMKKKFVLRTPPQEYLRKVKKINLRFFLPYILSLISNCVVFPASMVRRDCLGFSAVYGIRATTEYSFKNLSKKKKKALLFETAVKLIKRSSYQHAHLMRPDVLCYLLSLMTSDEQLRLLMEHPCDVLTCFLQWPWQDLFLDIADVVWTFLPENRFKDLLRKIKEHTRSYFVYLPNFFQQFFLRLPVEFRRYLLDEECRDAFFFTEFFYAEDSHGIQVVFRNMDAVDKERLVFSEKFLKLSDDFLLKDRWHIVEECVQKAKLSKEDRDRLKKAFAEFVRINDSGIESDSTKNKRKRFFQFLDGEETCAKDEKHP